MNVASNTKIDKLRPYCIVRVANIVPHHCGDHSDGQDNDCVMLQTQRKFIAKHRSEEKACDAKSSDK